MKDKLFSKLVQARKQARRFDREGYHELAVQASKNEKAIKRQLAILDHAEQVAQLAKFAQIIGNDIPSADVKQ